MLFLMFDNGYSIIYETESYNIIGRSVYYIVIQNCQV
jgi:hypothetical protein